MTGSLADVALNEDVASRFERVVICSGDRLFAIVAKYLLNSGLRVEVVARKGSISGALRRVAPTVHEIRQPPGLVA